MSNTICLAIPHTPWVPERVESMNRLYNQLAGPGPVRAFMDVPYAEFREKAPISKWARDLWAWQVAQNTDWCMQLQDDTTVAPRFWPKLQAMLASLPQDAGIIGLAATHPLAMEIARRGHRWYRTDAMLIGWAWVIRRPVLQHFLSVVTDKPFKCEDEQLGQFADHYGYKVWHPCPTLVDHDTSIASTYQNDAHSTRRPQVTWRDYGGASMEDPTWWAPGGLPEILPMPPQRMCCLCLEYPEVMHSTKTNMGICGVCIGKFIGFQFQPSIPTA